MTENYKSISLPVYIISLPERLDRRENIFKEFADKPEFEIHMVEAIKHKIGAVGLWLSIKKIIEEVLVKNDDDFIILCEDDHHFTHHYDCNMFISNIIDAASVGAQLLYGGVCRFGDVVPVKEGLFWVDWSWCTQFVVIYRTAFQSIINAHFTEKDVADEYLSTLFSNKFLIYPFISVQKDFGYSDIELKYDGNHFIKMFTQAEEKLCLYSDMVRQYKILK